MQFMIHAIADDCRLTAKFETAKSAFAKAVEWHVVYRFSNISISIGDKSYSIDEFSSLMALGTMWASTKKDQTDYSIT